MKSFVACFFVLAGTLVCSAGEQPSVLMHGAPEAAQAAPASNDCAAESCCCCCRPGVFSRAAARRDCRIAAREECRAERLSARAAEACCNAARHAASACGRLATVCRCCR